MGMIVEQVLYFHSSFSCLEGNFCGQNEKDQDKAMDGARMKTKLDLTCF